VEGLILSSSQYRIKAGIESRAKSRVLGWCIISIKYKACKIQDHHPNSMMGVGYAQ
jgi:hypothetical protein